MDKKVSLIVPMYMCDEFVDTLMDRLLGQDYKNIEIICVVDGSTDRTEEFVKKRAEEDGRVRVLSQEHKGAGAARNHGLSEATGDYVMFPDADDKYNANYVSRMVQAMDRSLADMAVCQFRQIDHARRSSFSYCGYDCLSYPDDTPVPTTSIALIIKKIAPIPHNKIFRRDFIMEEGLRFSETMSENDTFFSAETVVAAKTIAFVKEHLFDYMLHLNPKSISTNRGNNPGDTAIVYRELYEWLKARGEFSSHKNDFLIKWRFSMHNCAMYCRPDVYPEIIVREITEEEPWKNMTDEELQRWALLGCAIVKKDLKKQRRNLAKASPQEDTKYLRERIMFAEREIENCEKIRKLLEEGYGKKLDRPETTLSTRMIQVRQFGIRSSIQIVRKKILARFCR